MRRLNSTAAWVATWASAWVLLSPSSSRAALCEESFNLQSAQQYIYTTQNTGDLGTPVITTLKTDLSDMRILFDSTIYQILVGFDGACGAFTKKPVRFKARNKGEKTLKDAVVNDISIRMFDSNTVLTGHDYAYWFGFALKPDTVIYAIGKGKQADAEFETWYGVALLQDSTRNTTSGLWSASSSYQLMVNGPTDKSALTEKLLSGWKNITFDANHQGTFTVQLLRITYDAKPTGIQRAARPRSAASGLAPRFSGFTAQQNGGQVRLQVSESIRQGLEGASLELYDMFGHRVASVHPTGSAYFWNGKTLQGPDARSGIYFAQLKGKVLGKFFYSK